MIKKLLDLNKKIVLFDGDCNLCDWSVQLLLKNDPHDVFRFASLQSNIGKEIQREYGIDSAMMSSIILIDDYSHYKTKTSAIFSMTRSMGKLWSLFNMFWIVPQPIRDWVYTKIAKNRYRWFGKKNTCMVMTDDIRHKFLENRPKIGIIFDFFGVISSEVHPVWLHKHNLINDLPENMSDKIDLGLITEKEYQNFYAKKVGLTQFQVAKEMNELVNIDMAVIALINKLKSNNYPIHLLSNAHHDFLRPLLKKYNLINLFDSITISSELGIKKPDKEIYEIVISKSKLPPQNLLFVDDNKSNLIPANELGILTHHFTNIDYLKDFFSRNINYE